MSDNPVDAAGLADALHKPAGGDLHARVIHLMVHLVGRIVEVKTKSGDVLQGIFHGATTTSPLGVVLKLARVMTSEDVRPDIKEVVVLPSTELVEVTAKEVPLFLDAGAASALQSESRESRNLKRWNAESHQTQHVDMSLDGDLGGWDQFEANRRLFGVSSSWNEDLYTKPLDMSTVSSRQRKDAERVAREIEKRGSSNVHIREERGMRDDYADLDEESRYSAVLSSSRHKESPTATRATVEHYVVPARRPLTPEQDDEPAEPEKKTPVVGTGLQTLGGVISVSNLNPNARTWAPPTNTAEPPDYSVMTQKCEDGTMFGAISDAMAAAPPLNPVQMPVTWPAGHDKGYAEEYAPVYPIPAYYPYPHMFQPGPYGPQ